MTVAAYASALESSIRHGFRPSPLEPTSLEAALTGSLKFPRSEFYSRWLDLAHAGATDRDKVALAFDCCHGMVFSTARRITGSPWEAEDVTQLVFEILAKNIRRLRDPARLPGFLKSTAVRVALRKTSRSRRRRQKLLVETPLLPSTPSGADTTTIVQQCLMKLEPQERVAVVLKYVEAHTHEEMAELMGVSVGTARRRLEAGRLKLVELLGEQGADTIFGQEGSE